MLNKKYRRGIENLRSCIEDAEGIAELNIYEFRFEHNTAQERLFSPTQDTRAERNRIFAGLDRLSREQTGKNFRYWCKPEPVPGRRSIVVKVSLLIATVLVIAPSIYFFRFFPHPGPTLTPALSSLPSGLVGTVKLSNGQYIGVNDGSSSPFDTARPDYDLKMQAAQALGNDAQTANALWNQCLIGPDTNDAEVKIYLENQRVLASNHVTLVVGLNFLQDSSQDVVQRSVLQGASIAQKEFNDRHKNIKLRLLLANTGGDLSYIRPVVRQIASIAKHDSSVVGILGWPTSSRTQNVLSDLQQAGMTLPVVSESAVADTLTNIAPNFFRVVPPDQVQASVMVWLATQRLHAAHAIIFFDPNDVYGQNLFQDLQQQFPHDLQPEHFTIGQTSAPEFTRELRQALKNRDPSNTVLILAATFGYDADQFQAALTPKDFPGWITIAGASGAVANKNVYGRWYVVSSAFHDEWPAFMGGKAPAPFFQDYHSAFDPYNQHLGYYYQIPDNYAIVSYDAANVLLHAVDLALQSSVTSPTGQNIVNKLQQIKGSQAWQGLSGLISFDAGSDPTNKALIVLQVDTTGHLQMVCAQGRFANHVSNAIPRC
jgi:eukaryotic-like serine/threonine-protein kinase